MVFDDVVVNLNIGRRQHDHAGTRWHDMNTTGKGADFGEVRRVVGFNVVIKNPNAGTVFAVTDWQVKNQDATGVAGGCVAIHVRFGAVFDFDTGNVFLGDVITYNDFIGLANVDTGIGRAFHITVFNQHVAGLYRVQAVGTVG